MQSNKRRGRRCVPAGYGRRWPWQNVAVVEQALHETWIGGNCVEPGLTIITTFQLLQPLPAMRGTGSMHRCVCLPGRVDVQNTMSARAPAAHPAMGCREFSHVICAQRPARYAHCCRNRFLHATMLHNPPVAVFGHIYTTLLRLGNCTGACVHCCPPLSK
eukprot:COSAG02_NODE_2333_length_9117_cov_5.841428_4_plen_160_part_00